jgi:hypothetical protein
MNHLRCDKLIRHLEETLECIHDFLGTTMANPTARASRHQHDHRERASATGSTSLEDQRRRIAVVLAETRFPAMAWELAAEAFDYGADAQTQAELAGLPSRRYDNLRDVLAVICAPRQSEPHPSRSVVFEHSESVRARLRTASQQRTGDDAQNQAELAGLSSPRTDGFDDEPGTASAPQARRPHSSRSVVFEHSASVRARLRASRARQHRPD